MPTRRPTISESARLVSSWIRCAAASVSFITCGRGRGFGFAAGVGELGVMSVIYSVLAANQCCQFHSFSFEHDLVGKPASTFPDHALSQRLTTYSEQAGPRRSS